MRKSITGTILSLVTSLAYQARAESVIAGPATATLTIEEFSDLECPYCVRGANTMSQALKDFPSKIKLVFRNMPLPFHSNALNAAKAMSAIYLQSPSMAFSFQKEIFSNQGELTRVGENFLYDTAQKLGADVARMKNDMSGPAVAKMLADDQQAADLHNFKGTPSFMIGTEAVTGALPYPEIQKIIAKQLATPQP